MDAFTNSGPKRITQKSSTCRDISRGGGDALYENEY